MSRGPKPSPLPSSRPVTLPHQLLAFSHGPHTNSHPLQASPTSPLNWFTCSPSISSLFNPGSIAVSSTSSSSSSSCLSAKPGTLTSISPDRLPAISPKSNKSSTHHAQQIISSVTSCQTARLGLNGNENISVNEDDDSRSHRYCLRPLPCCKQGGMPSLESTGVIASETAEKSGLGETDYLFWHLLSSAESRGQENRPTSLPSGRVEVDEAKGEEELAVEKMGGDQKTADSAMANYSTGDRRRLGSGDNPNPDKLVNGLEVKRTWRESGSNKGTATAGSVRQGALVDCDVNENGFKQPDEENNKKMEDKEDDSGGDQSVCDSRCEGRGIPTSRLSWEAPIGMPENPSTRRFTGKRK
ncbi:unnamed protein product [Protopolystoma xenopodis]|uniref:Uncharacterized protein n=1 Tax=Protopolystoma xenopodis TaxID=117903 RepID=A0A448X0J7_9PLAT|nr:unnamed protein product [Protopolystoma xenopodis]